jgi:hypothetical protein
MNAAAVACWIGTAASRERFDAALTPMFSADGDFLGSEWSRAFGIGYYDEGRKESGWIDNPTRSLRHLLQGMSYANELLPRLEDLATNMSTSNVFVLLYDQPYDGDTHHWETDGVVMRFVGNVHRDASR